MASWPLGSLRERRRYPESLKFDFTKIVECGNKWNKKINSVPTLGIIHEVQEYLCDLSPEEESSPSEDEVGDPDIGGDPDSGSEDEVGDPDIGEDSDSGLFSIEFSNKVEDGVNFIINREEKVIGDKVVTTEPLNDQQQDDENEEGEGDDDLGVEVKQQGEEQKEEGREDKHSTNEEHLIYLEWMQSFKHLFSVVTFNPIVERCTVYHSTPSNDSHRRSFYEQL